MSDIIPTSKALQIKINDLESCKDKIKESVVNKARAVSNYDKTLALVMFKLRNGEKIRLEDQEIHNPPVSIIDKLAKGICFQECFDKEVADGEYRALLTSIDIIQSQLNGYQSINRHLS